EAIGKGAPTPPKGGPVADPRPAAPQPQPRMRASAARSARWPQNWIDWLRIRRNWMTVAGIVFGLILLLVLGTFAYAYATLPDPSRLDLAAGDVKIVDRNLNTIEVRNAQGVRVIPKELTDISPNLQNATIAVEDKHFYGHNATGVEAAAEVYFGKHAKDLTLGEASLLAGLPNGPSYYDPALHKERALARQAVVLDAMVNTGMITSAQAEQAKNEPLTFVFKENRSSLAPHFVDYVFDQLETVYGPSAINTGGLTVKTTLDLNMQKAAEQAVAVGQQRLGRLGADNGDFLAIDPKTGQILAMVGSADYLNNDIKGQFNVVTALRQPGSS